MTETLQKTENVAENIANKKLQLLKQVSAFELRDQLQIKDMRISKLKEKNAELKELLKECKMPIEVYNEMFGNKEELLTKIDEVLKCGNVL